jgi:hypothetical protein
VADKSDNWGVWAIIGAAAVVGYYLIKPDETPPLAEPIPMPQLPVVAEQAVKVAEKPLEPVMPKPTPRYDATEDRVYFYLGAASEDEKKRGIASGPTLAFRYYGRDANNEHVLRSYTANGYPVKFYYCSDPCRLMRDDSGERTVINDGTIMGSVVDDIRNGFLQKSKRQQQKLPEPLIESQLEVEPVGDTEQAKLPEN